MKICRKYFFNIEEFMKPFINKYYFWIDIINRFFGWINFGFFEEICIFKNKI